MKLKKLFIISIIFILMLPTVNIYSVNEPTDSTSSSGEILSKDISQEVELSAKAALVIDSHSGLSLYEKNAKQIMYPASTTKILTAIIILENCDLAEKITVTNSAISAIPAGYSSANLIIGEEMSVKDLVTVFLVHSANDAGYVLAEYYGHSIDGFAEIMNQKANEIGCKNSHFVNPSGIHDDNHYTTAYDLSLIAKYCMQNKTFREIVSLEKCTINATNKSGIRQYINTNSLLNSSSKYFLEDCIGIKTGYTKEAGNCLVSCFSRDNLELICVVLGSSGSESNSRFIDSVNLHNYAYNNYAIKTIASANDVIQTIEVSNGTKETRNLNLILANDINSLVNLNEPTPEPIIALQEKFSAPIAKDTELGTATYTINGITYSEKLIAANDVERDTLLLNLFGTLFAIIIILILIMFLFSKSKKRKRKKMKYHNSY